MKDFKLPDETVGTVIREKVKYCEWGNQYDSTERWGKVYVPAVRFPWIDNAGIRKEVCFNVYCIYICISFYTLYYRGFLKSKRKKRAYCGRHYRNQEQTASCLEVSSENRWERGWERYKKVKGDLTKVHAMLKKKIRRKKSIFPTSSPVKCASCTWLAEYVASHFIRVKKRKIFKFSSIHELCCCPCFAHSNIINLRVLERIPP